MAQNTRDQSDSPADTDSEFHYYSGGEVKELSHTNVSPWLWVFWSLVILGVVGYLVFGGALGPQFGGYRPAGGSQASLDKVQTVLNQEAHGGGQTAQQADMMQLTPFLGGETLVTSVANGQNTYQSYCIGCHGPNQDGNGVNASALNPKPRNLRDAPFMRETMTYNRINSSLHYGVHGTAMPRWENTLSEHEIQEVISYVLSLSWTMPSSTMQPTQTIVHSGGVPVNPNASGGSSVHGNSVQTSPKPITPAIGGNPAAATSTSPPSASGQPAAVNPSTVQSNTPDAGTPASGTPSAMPSAPLHTTPAPPGGLKAPDAGGESVTPPFSPGQPATH